jgi:hypothetical protein
MSVDIWGLDFDAGQGEHDAGHGFSYTVFWADEAKTIPLGVAEYHGCEKRQGKDWPDAPALLPFDVPAAADWHKGRDPKYGPGPKWQLVQLDPLTVAPSILCRGCGLHGYLRAGRWEPC